MTFPSGSVTYTQVTFEPVAVVSVTTVLLHPPRGRLDWERGWP